MIQSPPQYSSKEKIKKNIIKVTIQKGHNHFTKPEKKQQNKQYLICKLFFAPLKQLSETFSPCLNIFMFKLELGVFYTRFIYFVVNLTTMAGKS